MSAPSQFCQRESDIAAGREGLRVAWFGGTFDPPHRGHLRVAIAAADAFHLDTLLFAPTGRQPLKRKNAAASFEDRLRMVSLTCSYDTRCEVSNLDAPRQDHQPNYTVDALLALRELYPFPSRLFAILGADSFLDLPKWHDFENLARLAEWIVVSRPGYETSTSHEERCNFAGIRAHFLTNVNEDVSATALRKKLLRGENCDSYLLPEVSAYIQEHHLYQELAESAAPA